MGVFPRVLAAEGSRDTPLPLNGPRPALLPRGFTEVSQGGTIARCSISGTPFCCICSGWTAASPILATSTGSGSKGNTA